MKVSAFVYRCRPDDPCVLRGCRRRRFFYFSLFFPNNIRFVFSWSRDYHFRLMPMPWARTFGTDPVYLTTGVYWLWGEMEIVSEVRPKRERKKRPGKRVVVA